MISVCRAAWGACLLASVVAAPAQAVSVLDFSYLHGMDPQEQQFENGYTINVKSSRGRGAMVLLQHGQRTLVSGDRAKFTDFGVGLYRVISSRINGYVGMGYHALDLYGRKATGPSVVLGGSLAIMPRINGALDVSWAALGAFKPVTASTSLSFAVTPSVSLLGGFAVHDLRDRAQSNPSRWDAATVGLRLVY